MRRNLFLDYEFGEKFGQKCRQLSFYNVDVKIEEIHERRQIDRDGDTG